MSGQMEYDKEKNNLIQQIQDLQERMEQLERYALTSSNIRAARLLVAEDGVGQFDDMEEGQISVQQVLQLLSTATQGPGSGKGLELYYSLGSDIGRIQSYDRDAAAYKDLQVKGDNLDLMSGGSNSRIYLSSSGNIGMHGDAEDITRRIENSQAYYHDTFSYHFDGSDYPMSGWTWQTYGGRVVPTGQTESNSKLYWGFDKGGGATTWKSFYARSSGIHVSASLHPHFSNSSQPVRVGFRWDDASDTNYVEFYWESKLDGSSLMITTPYIKSVTGGGAATTTQIAPDYPAGLVLPTLRGNVEGTQWSSWAIRTFISGWNTRRWGPSHSSKTWTPTRSGIFIDNASGSNTSWQYLGFDSLAVY